MVLTEMISSLVGKKVIVADVVLGVRYDGVVMEIDENWMKIERTVSEKKGTKSTTIVALDNIGSIQIQ